MATFGYQGTSDTNFNLPNYIVGGKYQTGNSDFTLISITAYIKWSIMPGGTTKAKCCIYDTDYDLIADSTTVELSTLDTSFDDWYEFTYSGDGPSLTANTYYYITIWGTTGTGSFSVYANEDTGDGVIVDDESYGESFPESITAGGFSDANDDLLIYGSYEDVMGDEETPLSIEGTGRILFYGGSKELKIMTVE